jgi:hypothetical protein
VREDEEGRNRRCPVRVGRKRGRRGEKERIWNENQNLAFIFGGLAPEQVPHIIARSKRNADGRQEGAAEAASNRIRLRHWWPHDR